MHRRPRLALSWQTLLAGVAGGGLGLALDSVLPGTGLLFCHQLAGLAGSLFLGWLHALAGPLIVSSLILGAVGLEPMRSLRKVTARTLRWMAASGLAAVLLGGGAAFCMSLLPGTVYFPLDHPLEAPAGSSLPVELSPVVWGWFALVLLGLGFGYYRNQIEEGHGRMIIRLCQGMEEMLSLLLDWTVARLVPWGVFALLFEAGSQPRLAASVWQTWALVWRVFTALLLGWGVAGLVVLPAALWMLARVNPWQYLGTMLPAIGTAFASGSPVAALPVTMHGVREKAHVSNRVGSHVLSLGAVLQREGMALGWVVLAVYRHQLGDLVMDGRFWMIVLLTAWLMACGAGVLLPGSGSVVLLSFGWMNGFRSEWMIEGLVLERFVTMGGAALSAWSHACAALVIARSEGEYWVPGPPPDADEIEGLKNDLATAES